MGAAAFLPPVSLLKRPFREEGQIGGRNAAAPIFPVPEHVRRSEHLHPLRRCVRLRLERSYHPLVGLLD